MALVYCYLCHHFYDEADGVFVYEEADGDFDDVHRFVCNVCDKDLSE